MPRTHAASNTERGLAPVIAQGTLGLMALAQIALVVSAVMKLHATTGNNQPRPLLVLTDAPQVLPKVDAWTNFAPPYPAAPLLTAVPAPVVSTGKPMDRPSRPVLPAGGEIKDARIAETVEAAREVRKMGDMKTALDALRKADLHEPNHPEILSEMALTYEAMGLAEKSQAEWHRVSAMGEAMAGGYYTLARSKLDGAETPDAGSLSNSTPEVKPIALGRCEWKRDLTFTAGEKVTLGIPVKPLPGQSVHAVGINPEVYVFDQLADGRVVPSVAEKSPARWIPAVVDWTNPLGAVVEVDFTLPPQTAEFAGAHGGVRKLHGYMVKLYHDYKLMGEQAAPAQLLNYSPHSSAPAGAENALFPRN